MQSVQDEIRMASRQHLGIDIASDTMMNGMGQKQCATSASTSPASLLQPPLFLSLRPLLRNVDGGLQELLHRVLVVRVVVSHVQQEEAFDGIWVVRVVPPQRERARPDARDDGWVQRRLILWRIVLLEMESWNQRLLELPRRLQQGPLGDVRALHELRVEDDDRHVLAGLLHGLQQQEERGQLVLRGGDHQDVL
eukprot:UN4263